MTPVTSPQVWFCPEPRTQSVATSPLTAIACAATLQSAAQPSPDPPSVLIIAQTPPTRRLRPGAGGAAGVLGDGGPAGGAGPAGGGGRAAGAAHALAPRARRRRRPARAGAGGVARTDAPMATLSAPFQTLNITCWFQLCRAGTGVRAGGGAGAAPQHAALAPARRARSRRRPRMRGARRVPGRAPSLARPGGTCANLT